MNNSAYSVVSRTSELSSTKTTHHQLNIRSAINPNLNRRQQFGLALLEKSLFVIGGRDGLKTLNTVDCYSLDRDTWISYPSLTSHRYALQATILGDQDEEPILLSVGGHDGWSFLSSVERYDFGAKAWTSVSPMLNARSNFGLALLGNLCFVLGGRDSASSLNLCEYYNPLTNKW